MNLPEIEFTRRQILLKLNFANIFWNSDRAESYPYHQANEIDRSAVLYPDEFSGFYDSETTLTISLDA